MNVRLLTATAAFALAMGLGMSAQAASTLRYCSEGSPEGFGPQLYDSGTTLDAVRPVFNRLVEIKFGTTDPMPSLAEKWDVSDDGLTYTFHLRKGVKFQTTKFFKPSREFNADDVVFSFNRMLDKNNPYHNVSGGSYAYFEGMGMPDTIKSVEKVDDSTVKITLTHPEAPFISEIAMEWASILSAEYADQLTKEGKQEQIDQMPVGTGPFSFVSYEKDAVIRYKANPTYWRGKQKIDNLVFAITKDPAVRKAKLIKGECDIMPYPAAADIEALKADPKLTVEESPGLNIAYLTMNATMKPFDNKTVRQAINMAINKDAIIKAEYMGGAIAATNVLPPTIWGYNKDVKGYAYDPAKAKEMLEGAGVKDLSVDLWYQPVSRPYNLDGKKMGELMQADLAKVGIKANLVTYDWAEYLKRLHNGEAPMAQIGWTGDIGDPDNFLYLHGCNGTGTPPGQNNEKWCNNDYDALLKQGKETSDQAKRIEIYAKAEQIVSDEAAVVPIVHSVVYMPMSKKVEGYVMDPLGFHNFEGVALK
ncbi:MAG TPA: ABC transporter substrate-binding protein [Dongiaceae bacterium]|nr:ABC transporter substrate-binding protein [Dongiaceae bacterium]